MHQVTPWIPTRQTAFGQCSLHIKERGWGRTNPKKPTPQHYCPLSEASSAWTRPHFLFWDQNSPTRSCSKSSSGIHTWIRAGSGTAGPCHLELHQSQGTALPAHSNTPCLSSSLCTASWSLSTGWRVHSSVQMDSISQTNPTKTSKKQENLACANPILAK